MCNAVGASLAMLIHLRRAILLQLNHLCAINRTNLHGDALPSGNRLRNRWRERTHYDRSCCDPVNEFAVPYFHIGAILSELPCHFGIEKGVQGPPFACLCALLKQRFG